MSETASYPSPTFDPLTIEYVPRHAVPNAAELEGQAAAATEYRYDQRFRQILAEYDAERGPQQPGATPDEIEQFKTEQLWIAEEAKVLQEKAREYAEEKLSQVYGKKHPYTGKHRKEDKERPPEPTPAAEPVEIRPEETEGEATPTPGQLPAQAKLPPKMALPPIKRRQPPRAEHPAPAEAKHRAQEVEQPQERAATMGPLKRAWYAAGAAVGTYFSHPEKGRRRRLVAIGGAVLAAGAAAFLYAHSHEELKEHITPSQPSSSPAETPSTPPSSASCPPVQHNAQFYNDLQPKHYHGEPYEWYAIANQTGPDNASSTLRHMISDARSGGVQVHTWGNPQGANWGISSVTVELSNGSHKTYYDTPHKLAILQYYSWLRHNDANSENC